MYKSLIFIECQNIAQIFADLIRRRVPFGLAMATRSRTCFDKPKRLGNVSRINDQSHPLEKQLLFSESLKARAIPLIRRFFGMRP